MNSDNDSDTTVLEHSKLKDYNRKRGTIKAKLTLFTKYLSKIVPESLSADQTIEIELRLNKISNLLQEFEEVQDSIETICTDIEEQLLERETFENAYFQSVAKAKGFIKQVDAATSLPTATTPRSSLQPTGESISESIKYPEISLPSFNGNITTWIEFRDTFDALINKSNLKSILKFKYLRGCLKDNALEVISALEYSEDSYAIAWQLLCERFNNPRVLVNHHLRALLNVDTIPNTAPALRSLSDNISKHLRSLRSLNVSTDGWDVLLIFFLTAKLERSTLRKWEEKIHSKEIPTLQEFKAFLTRQADLLESLSHAAPEAPEARAFPPRKAMVTTSSPSQPNKVIPKGFKTLRNQCPNCKEGHFINQCPKFLALNPASRINAVKRLGLCLNCLGSNHILPNCRASNCRTCKGKHHTLLHIVPTEAQVSPPQSTMGSAEPIPSTSSSNNPTQSVNLTTNQQTNILPDACAVIKPKHIILSTAQVKVIDNNNQTQILRALLDSGSQSNFLSERAAQILNLPTQNINLEVLGFNENVTNINKQCDLTVMSKDETYLTKLTCFIVPNICNLPTYSTQVKLFNVPQRFTLADESFLMGGEIDIIIGAEQFYQLLCIGQHRLGDGLPILQRTRLGWVVSGAVNGDVPPQRVSCNFVCKAELKAFWGTEDEHPLTNLPNDDYTNCEKVFSEHTRNSDGNFVVALPLKEPATALGESRHIVIKRFKTLESKFARKPEFKEKYVNFMNEFKEAGHMVECTPSKECNYLAHHAVINLAKTTTPLRVVIDPSFQTTTGKSLNDIQYKGTVLQDDLMDILLRFRSYKYVINADIEKMYRMIYIKQDHQRLQCILWRDNPSQPLLTYKLTTLSFGLKCAPYVATRCLLQLSYENKTQFPDAAAAIASSFYMDDLIYGGDNEQQVAETAVRIHQILKGAKFNLRKWNSNSTHILQTVSSTNTPTNTPPTTLGHDTQKVLGLAWCSGTDDLLYQIKRQPIQKPLTKRKVLSLASAIFDPLGLLGPVLIIAKCFIQRLWKIKSDWDEKLALDLSNEWEDFYNGLFTLNSLVVPRYVILCDYITLEIHGFCDSSLSAYGAAIYVRSTDRHNNILTRLLCAKTRVARSETIPRLELRSALLLAILYDKVIHALKCRLTAKYFWSDSNVALAWIKSQQPCKLNCFVKNQVIKIRELTDTKDWHWVTSSENPADLLSRGLHAYKLADCTKWWEGPAWLSKPKEVWPSHRVSLSSVTQEAVETHCNVCTSIPPNELLPNLFDKWSNVNKLTRCFAFMLRFINNCRERNNKLNGPLSVNEINESLSKLIRFAQIESYPVEFQLLQSKKPIPKSSNLLSLNPFMENQLIKVGGRLGLSHYPHHKKYPTVLPPNHNITKLIMRNEHVRLMHAGPQLLLSSIRERYWPINGKSLATKIVQRCVTCFRAKPKIPTPIMGNLPTNRVTPAPPFHTTGVDYAGPFTVRDRRGRGYKTTKCYIAIFVCLVTKAIHIELVSSLETSAFLSAFRRFIARRGKPKEMLSDNGSTFHGAHNELTELYAFLAETNNSSDLITSCASEGIQWKFLPPYSPHIGGLHEAAVRSCKTHLKKILGNALLTYEEFSTVLTQIEGILNSRPLCPIPSSNDDEISFLTPAHFLIGRSPTSMPDYDYEAVPVNRLTMYQQLQQLQQNFWRRWSRDYIGLLQERVKWRSSKGRHLAVGSVVLVREDRLPPCQWRMGRIVGCSQGRDGVSRIAEINTTRGVIKRAFNNICPMPVD